MDSLSDFFWKLDLFGTGIQTICLGFLTILLLWFLYVNRHRRVPPGPLTFPLTGNLNIFTSKNILQSFRELRSKYGDLFSLRMGSFDVVVVNGYDNMKELFLKKGDEVSDRPESYVFKDIAMGQGLVGSSGTLWKTHRTFTISTLRSFGFGKRSIEAHIQEEVAVFLQEVEYKHGRPIDVEDILQISVSNIVCSVVFGQRYEYSDERFRKLIRIFNENMCLAGPSSVITIFPFLKNLPGDIFKGKLILRNCQKLVDFLDTLVREHNESYDENNIRDYIDAYLKEQKQNTPSFSDIQLLKAIIDLGRWL